jgi:SH3-like domain-containing protein
MSAVPLAIVEARKLELRIAPSEGDDLIDTYARGASLRVLGRNAHASWLKVSIPDGKEGWMLRSVIKTNATVAKLDKSANT